MLPRLPGWRAPIDRSKGLPEQLKDLVYLVHSQRPFPLLQLPDESQSNPGLLGEIDLGQTVDAALLSHEILDVHRCFIPFRGEKVMPGRMLVLNGYNPPVSMRK